MTFISVCDECYRKGDSMISTENSFGFSEYVSGKTMEKGISLLRGEHECGQVLSPELRHLLLDIRLLHLPRLVNG